MLDATFSSISQKLSVLPIALKEVGRIPSN
jgi:hypothetical protein